MCVCIPWFIGLCIYLPTSLRKRDTTLGQFLNGNQQVWIQSYPSPILVAIPSLKRLICSTIYSQLKEEQIHTFPKGISAMWNANNFVADWTWVAVSISVTFTTRTLFLCLTFSLFLSLSLSHYIYIYMCVCVCARLNTQFIKNCWQGVFSSK